MNGRDVADPTAIALADALVEATSPHVAAVLLFGSRLAGTSPGAHSAYDFVVVVDAYLPFYRALAAAGHHRRPPRLLAALSRILPPNVTAFLPDLPGDPVAKCMILSGQDLERALAPNSPDHFVKGRMVQSVAQVWSRDRRVTSWIDDLLAAARSDVLRWAGPWVDEPFDAADLARRMLEISYRGELRPEARDRVREVFEAQRDGLIALYTEVLGDAVRRGAASRDADGGYRLPGEPGLLDRLGHRFYFLRSKVRATLRWVKHAVTFDDWLTYIQRKVERRTGRRVDLTARERRYPYLFLWPKVFHVLRTLPEGTVAGDGTPAAEGSATGDAPAAEGSATGSSPASEEEDTP